MHNKKQNTVYGLRLTVYGKAIKNKKLRTPHTVHRTPRKGFTLIELMLVVIILGILVAMVVPRLVGRGEQARMQAAEADIRSNIALGLDLYELDNGKYPEKLEDLMKDPGESKAPNWNGPYLKRKPVDPWRREYSYKSPGQHNPDYDLYSLGSDGVEGGDDDITNWEEEAE